MDPITNRLQLVLVLIGLELLTGCQLPYLVKSSYNQLSLLSAREDIDKVLQDNSLSQDERQKLNLSKKVKEFSVRRLHLKESKNYTSYVKLNRDSVTYVVNASKPWELKHFEWSYPIVGSMPYKGFFDLQDAKDEELALKNQGFDTYLRGVSAYSTLGWFNDPILSSMLKSDEHDLVNTIIHETVHLTLYIKNSADFNERMAVFLGNKGTELFYLENEGENSKTLLKIKQENEDQKIFSTFISEKIKKIEKWYVQQTDKNEALRQQQFAEIKSDFEKDFLPRAKTNYYSRFSKVPINNARLLLYKTYEQDLSDFEELFIITGNSFEKFLEHCRGLEKHPQPEIGLKELIKKLKSESNPISQ